MMPNPIRVIHDVSTGQVVERELTNKELAEREADAEAFAEAFAEARQAESSTEARLAAIEARLDRAAHAQVTGDAAKVRDGLKPS